MGLDATGKIDAIGVERDSEVVVLSIVDSWTWEDEQLHLQALQDKINAYFAFVESGEIYSLYPSAAENGIRIDVIGRYDPPVAALVFLKRASEAASQLGLVVRHRSHQEVG